MPQNNELSVPLRLLEIVREMPGSSLKSVLQEAEKRLHVSLNERWARDTLTAEGCTVGDWTGHPVWPPADGDPAATD